MSELKNELPTKQSGMDSDGLDYPAIIASGLGLMAIVTFLNGAYRGTAFFLLAALCVWLPGLDQRWAKKVRWPALALLSVVGLLVMPPLPKTAQQPLKAPSSDTAPAKDQDRQATKATPERKPPTAAEIVLQQRAMEKRNAAKIAELVALEKTVPTSNVETRLQFWNEISALAPDNTDYTIKRTNLQAESDQLQWYRDNPELAGKVVKVKGRKGGFGNVLIMDITIENKGLSHLKDFQVICSLSGPSGSMIDENRLTIFEIVEARSTRTIRNVNMGLINTQAASANCRIDGATIA